MKTLKKIVFFGSGTYTLPVIEMLQGNGLQLVITTEQNKTYIKFLESHRINFIQAKNIGKKEYEAIKNMQPDLGILASYGALIPQNVIDLFPLGILNIHPSLLPKFKGPAPVPYTITAGEVKTGVTIIQMDEELDHGPIIAQESLVLSGNETSQDLLELLFLTSKDMLKNIIQKANKDQEIKAYPQSIKNESWSEKLEKESGKINLKNPPNPAELNRKIRAFYPWPGIYLTASLKGKSKILKLLPQRQQGKSEATLPQYLIQVEGKKPMNYKDFINGYGAEAEHILAQLKLI